MHKKASTPRTVAVCIDTRDGAGRKRLYGVAQYARRQAWRMMLVRRGGREAAREVVRLRPQGILTYIADRWLIEAARRLEAPLADTALSEVEVPLRTTLDSDAVGELAAEHLSGLGLTQFGYCGVRGRAASAQRETALAAALARRGHRLRAFSQGVAEGESRMEPLVRWLRTLPKPVGILAVDDKLGERVLTACRWAGLEVPGQIAVLGIGDDELMCEVSWPSLSSIQCPTSRLGYEAAEMLDRVMHGQRLVERIREVAPTGVAVRGSTDTLAVADPLVQSAVRFLREHAGEAIGVKHVAQAVRVSRRTLDRRFDDALGRTVHDELAAVRMQKARNLLTDTSETIASIASVCGYETAASFSRAFRQHAGCWPTEYRNQVRVV